MKLSRLLTSLVISCLLFAMIPPLQAHSSTVVTTPLAGWGDNVFGYTMESASFEWHELSTGTGRALSFSESANDAILRIDLDFPMYFFENRYDEAYVSVNGFLAFKDPGNLLLNVNSPIPNDDQPNGIVAPLWTDVYLKINEEYKGGKVFYYYYDGTGNEGPDRYMVLEWCRVFARGSGDNFLTFEMILYEKGDIIFSYNELPVDGMNTATVGIEDAEGVDGVQYQYNQESPGLSPNTSIAFYRPPDGPRVKAFPKYRGEFLSNRLVDFPITVRNTGTDPDTFNLTYEILGGNLPCSVSFHEDSTQLLLDNTGELPGGGDRNIILRIISDLNANVGDYLSVKVTATSTTDSSKQFDVWRDTAVPAQFGQAINDPVTGVNVLFSLPENQVIEQPTDKHLSTIPALINVSHYVYLLAWENAGDIEYMTQNYLSRYTSSLHKIRDNSGGDLIYTNDTLPVIAATDDGSKIGVLFIRKVNDAFRGENDNIIFALLDSSGNLLKEVNITNNGRYGSSQDIDIDFFNYPAMAVTSDNQFVISWEKTRWITADNDSKKATVDIYMAALDQDGNNIVPVKRLTDSETKNWYFHEPVLTSLHATIINADGKKVSVNKGAYLNFSVFDNTLTDEQRKTQPSYKLGHVKFNEETLYPEVQSSPNGDLYYRMLGDWSGTKPDAVELQEGTILFAWSDIESSQIKYSVIHTASSLQNFAYSDPVPLDSPVGLEPDYVSVTRGKDNEGVVTWGDRQKYLLFYSLVNCEDGRLATPPMMFDHGIIPNDYLSFNGNMASTPLSFRAVKNFIPLIGW